MGLPFEEMAADFCKLLKRDRAWIEQVTHRTFVDVAEKGTEAAAVTAVEVGSAPMDPNRPFLYAIVDDETGMILFLGIFARP